MTRFHRWGLAGVALAAVGCPGGGDPTCAGVPAVKLSDLQAALITPSCAVGACHSGSRPAEGLDLSSGQTFAATVNVRSVLDGSKFLVDPVNAAASELYVQVSTDLMPMPPPKLNAAQKKQLHDWICSGAPND